MAGEVTWRVPSRTLADEAIELFTDRARRVLNGTQYGVRRVTVGEDEKCGRVRRHGEHDQGPPRNGRLQGVGSVLTVTVADGGDQLAQSRFRTVCYQHDLAPSPART